MSNHRDPKWALHHRLVSNLDLLEAQAASHGISFHVTSGARGFERQAILDHAYDQDREMARLQYGVVADPAPMGKSRHHPFIEGKAVAADLRVEAEDATVRAMKQRKLGELAESISLFWGGRFLKPDLVHFELKAEDGKRFDVDAEYIKLGALLDVVTGFTGT